MPTADLFMLACREGGERLAQALLAMDRAWHAICLREGQRVLGDKALAEDAVQEAFVKVWQRCATFRGDAELLSWVRGIVRNTVLDHWRRRHPSEDWQADDGAVRQDVEQAWMALVGAPATPEQALNEQQLAELFNRCQAAFDAASPLHAQVVRWVAVEGLSPAEVSALIGRSPGATREFLSQARKKARAYFEPWYRAQKAQESAVGGCHDAG